MGSTNARTPEGTRIRPIVAGDDARMATIIRRVMTEYGAVGEGYSIMDPEVDGMAGAYAGPDAAYFVALVDGEVVGGAGVGPLAGGPSDTCELKKMYVLPQARGRGLGRRLMEICLDAARDAGYRRCYLETLEHMREARGLYESHGFRPLEAPMGDTGHSGCNGWYIREL
jgi:putative acetyltransferase